MLSTCEPAPGWGRASAFRCSTGLSEPGDLEGGPCPPRRHSEVPAARRPAASAGCTGARWRSRCWPGDGAGPPRDCRVTRTRRATSTAAQVAGSTGAPLELLGQRARRRPAVPGEGVGLAVAAELQGPAVAVEQLADVGHGAPTVVGQQLAVRGAEEHPPEVAPVRVAPPPGVEHQGAAVGGVPDVVGGPGAAAGAAGGDRDGSRVEHLPMVRVRPRRPAHGAPGRWALAQARLSPSELTSGEIP